VIYYIVRKTNYNWQAIAAVLAFLMLVLTASWYLYSAGESKKLHHQHLKPEISCQMEYPIKVEGDKVFRNKSNPDIIIKNNGPIIALSVSCDLKTYVYHRKRDEVTTLFDYGFKGFTHAVSAQKLEPFSEVRYSCVGVNGEDLTAVYSLSITYHRESDMEPFSIREYFFTENGQYNFGE